MQAYSCIWSGKHRRPARWLEKLKRGDVIVVVTHAVFPGSD